MTVTQRTIDTQLIDRNRDHEEFGPLMSMALDGMLDGHDGSRLSADLATCEACSLTWQRWQTIDREFQRAPMAVSSRNLVDAVQSSLVAMDQRRRLRVGLVLVSLTVLIWLIGIAGVGFVLGFLVYSQVGWFGETLRGLSFVWATVAIWGESFAQILADLGRNPSTIGAVLGYVALSAVALGGWLRLLRRSTQASP